MNPSDFRSDTVTRPTPEMRKAMAEAEVGDDVIGFDPTVQKLEALAAETMGKEAGLFCPSGTMGNSIAVKAWTQELQEVIVESRSHIFNLESTHLTFISRVTPRPLPSRRGAMDPAEVEHFVKKPNVHTPQTTLICLENTHNNWGGAVVPLENFKAIREVAVRHGLRVHLDGARIFNASTASGVPVRGYADEVDSVMFCLSKGLSAPIGSMLVGPKDFIEYGPADPEGLGGGMRQVGVDRRRRSPRPDPDDRPPGRGSPPARRLAEALSALPGIVLNSRPKWRRTSSFSSSSIRSLRSPACFRSLEKRGIRAFAAPGGVGIRMVTHKDVGRGRGRGDRRVPGHSRLTGGLGGQFIREEFMNTDAKAQVCSAGGPDRRRLHPMPGRGRRGRGPNRGSGRARTAAARLLEFETPRPRSPPRRRACSPSAASSPCSAAAARSPTWPGSSRGFMILSDITEGSPQVFVSYEGDPDRMARIPYLARLLDRLDYAKVQLRYLPASGPAAAGRGAAESPDREAVNRNERRWEALGRGEVAAARSADGSSSAEVTPLLATKWNQDTPFWNYTPRVGGEPTPAGCSAVAMAQVMNYWKHPAQGQGSQSYTWNGQTLSADFNHPYHWSLMRDTYYAGTYTAAQADAVARLCSDVGISIDMQYAVDGSGSDINDNDALTAFFKAASPDAHETDRAEAGSWEAWFEVIRREVETSPAGDHGHL